MKLHFCILSVIYAVIILTINQTVNAQLPNSTISQIIDEKYGHRNIFMNATNTIVEIPATVAVDYESPTTVLISGDLINTKPRTFNADLWQAMDLLKNQFGFKLQNVMTSGVGSVGNPTTVYILMTN
jgi:hypothetical protein